MQENRTAAGYFIAIIAVVGGAWLMPPLPVLILISGPLVLLGFCLFFLIRKGMHTRQKHKQDQLTVQTTQVMPAQPYHTVAQNGTINQSAVTPRELEKIPV